MNTADFVMNYTSVEKLAEKINQTQEEFGELLTNLNSLVESMNGRWTGKAHAEFATAYSELQPKLQTIRNVLGNYANALSTAAANEATLESAHANLLYNAGIPSF